MDAPMTNDGGLPLTAPVIPGDATSNQPMTAAPMVQRTRRLMRSRIVSCMPSTLPTCRDEHCAGGHTTEPLEIARTSS